MKPDLAAAFARLAKPKPATLALPGSRTIRRQFDAINARNRAAIKALVKPENAQTVFDALPLKAGEHLHAVTPGDFIFCDLLTETMHRRPGAICHIATLSMSKKNADDLAECVKQGQCDGILFVLSNYFQKTNVAIWKHLETIHEKLQHRWMLKVCRTHAKVALFAWPNDSYLVIETSANLRSSQNIEQISAFADPEVYEFHCQWMQEAGE